MMSIRLLQNLGRLTHLRLGRTVLFSQLNLVKGPHLTGSFPL